MQNLRRAFSTSKKKVLISFGVNYGLPIVIILVQSESRLVVGSREPTTREQNATNELVLKANLELWSTS